MAQTHTHITHSSPIAHQLFLIVVCHSPPLTIYKAPPVYDEFTVTIITSGISDPAADGLVERRAQVALAPVPHIEVRRLTSGRTMPPPPPCPRCRCRRCYCRRRWGRPRPRRAGLPSRISHPRTMPDGGAWPSRHQRRIHRLSKGRGKVDIPFVLVEQEAHGVRVSVLRREVERRHYELWFIEGGRG